MGAWAGMCVAEGAVDGGMDVMWGMRKAHCVTWERLCDLGEAASKGVTRGKAQGPHVLCLSRARAGREAGAGAASTSSSCPGPSRCSSCLHAPRCWCMQARRAGPWRGVACLGWACRCCT